MTTEATPPARIGDPVAVDPLDLLARAGRLLWASLDVEETLANVARVIVPELADWCAIDLTTDCGALRQVALVHADASLTPVLDEMRRQYLPRLSHRGVVRRVLNDGRAVLSDVADEDDLAGVSLDEGHRGLLRTLGIRSSIVAPLRARGRAIGAVTMVVGHSGRCYDGRALALAEELGQRIGLALDNARLFTQADAACAEAEENQRRLRFLSEVSEALAASLDYRATVRAAARLAVPMLGDCCTVAILQEDGTIHRLAAAHADPEKERLITSVGDTVPHAPDSQHPATIVARTGQTMVLDALPDELLRTMARDEHHLEVLRAMGFTAALVVPLVARGRTLGAVSFAATRPGRRYGAEDVRLGEEVARRAAVAIDNARLYLEARRAEGRARHELALRTEAADALRRSEANFRRLFETNPLAMLVYDMDTLEILAVNDAAVEQYGYARDEFVGLPMTEVWLPEDVSRRLAFARSRPSMTYFNPAVSQHRGKDGRLLHVRVSTHALRFDGRDARLLTMQNVGEQLAAEERIRESDERLKRALAAARMATFDWDVRTGRVERSVGYEALYGLPPGAMASTSRAFIELVHPEDRARMRLDFEQDAHAPHSVLDDEFRVTWPDGTVRWLARRGTIYRDERGKPVRVLGTTMDVTERREAEEALHRSQARIANILDSIDEAFYTLDREWRFVEINRHAERYVSRHSPERAGASVLGATIWEVFPEVVGTPLEAALRRAMSAGEPTSVEYRSPKTAYWFEFHIYPSAEGLSVFYRDVTDRKRAEEERERLLDEREREADRLRELHERLQRSLEALLALHEVGQVLNAARDLDRVGARLLEIARRAASLDAAAIVRVDPRGALRPWKRIGPDELWRAAHHDPTARRARRAALADGSVRAYAIPPRAPCAGGLAGWCLPLRDGERTVGLIEAFGAPRPRDDVTTEILGSIAHQLATAMQNARLYGELAASKSELHELVRRLIRAQEEERNRLALEVHDGLGQLAASAQMHLEAFAYEHQPASPEARVKLGRAVELIGQTIAETRRLLAGLRPQPLDDLGLAKALQVHAERLIADGWDVTYREGLGDRRLPPEVETALFRVAQEALANVGKHAGSRRVRIELDRDERNVRLEVRDWGAGFDPSAPGAASRPGERLGLAGMRERVSSIGGHFEVRSAPGEGTRVLVRVPLAAQARRGGP